MNRPERAQRQYYRDTASRYESMHAEPEHDKALGYVLGLLRDRGLESILDVGCGTGRLLREMSSAAPRLSVYGVEPVDALLKEAVSKGTPSRHLVAASGTRLPFPDSSFDAVCEFAMLHHVPAPALVVEEMLRVARRAVFLSDSNRFGQGHRSLRWVKLILYHLGLWPVADLIRTRGKGYTETEGDGIAYSYSVYDSYGQLAAWADTVIAIPTAPATSDSWIHPAMTCSHILLCAFRD